MDVKYSGLVILYKMCQNITIKQLMQNNNEDDIKKYNSGYLLMGISVSKEKYKILSLFLKSDSFILFMYESSM